MNGKTLGNYNGKPPARLRLEVRLSYCYLVEMVGSSPFVPGKNSDLGSNAYRLSGKHESLMEPAV